ncbi:MAG: hypothetical protein KF746_16030 [Chitinophagaceae bacterium]|nr:hypothetical protein [Chitinophagaceae bacterium]
MPGLAVVTAPSWLSVDSRCEGKMAFLSPVDGDILHRYDGTMTENFLKTTVKVTAPAGSILTVNGVKTVYNNGIYTAEVTMQDFENVIELAEIKTKSKKRITVYWLKNLADKYRLSIDDAVWFLKDIQAHAEAYRSLFDNPFLGFLKQLHDAHGTKVHLNIFFQSDDFNLTQMTDKFKNEWRANADWLQLSFHAKAEFPDDPYKFAGYAQVKEECEDVIKEIRRFAGEELAASITTLHWGEVPVEVSRALRDAGYSTQLCDFNVDDGLPPCSYYLDILQRRHINKRFVWRDNREGIIFVKSSIIIDTKKQHEILPYLDRYEQQSRKPPYADLLIHEQYFYEHYHNYQPDYRQKVFTAVQWAEKNGYAPAFFYETANR